MQTKETLRVDVSLVGDIRLRQTLASKHTGLFWGNYEVSAARDQNLVNRNNKGREDSWVFSVKGGRRFYSKTPVPVHVTSALVVAIAVSEAGAASIGPVVID